MAMAGPDDALIIENRVQGKPHYIGFQLGSLWGESMEFGNRLGSLNGHQSEADPDGVIRLVVAHADPCVPNCCSTCAVAKCDVRQDSLTVQKRLDPEEVTRQAGYLDPA